MGDWHILCTPVFGCRLTTVFCIFSSFVCMDVAYASNGDTVSSLVIQHAYNHTLTR